MSLGTLLYTWFFGNLVGSDELSNKYYCNSTNFHDKNSKRWVIFKKEVEASNIPSYWHAWLHKSIETPPIKYVHKYNWQKKHISNKTGTSESYHPKKNNEVKKKYTTWKS